jgi:hypothetical protein
MDVVEAWALILEACQHVGQPSLRIGVVVWVVQQRCLTPGLSLVYP